jgi:hypothetical protein
LSCTVFLKKDPYGSSFTHPSARSTAIGNSILPQRKAQEQGYADTSAKAHKREEVSEIPDTEPWPLAIFSKTLSTLLISDSRLVYSSV